VSDKILVFVDALPWAERDKVQESAPALSWARPIQPGFGYSINVKSELFAGRTPDDAGFLNEWAHRPGAGLLPMGVPRTLERLVPSSSFPGRVTRKIFGKLLGENLRNIPLHLLHHLGRTGVNAYERDYSEPSLFTECGVDRFLYSEHGGDEPALAVLLERLKSDTKPVRAFLAASHLDHVMHAHGIGTKEYDGAVEDACQMAATLWDALQARGNGGSLALVSDHGMCTVTRSVSIDLESKFPGAGRRYGYFVDATMLRIWCEDPELLTQLHEFVEEQSLPGRILDETERRRWGVSTDGFGQLLLLLDEGAMFAPSFMGRTAAEAMHGYLPSLPSQAGLLLCSEDLTSTGGEDPVSALEAHAAFQAYFTSR